MAGRFRLFTKRFFIFTNIIVVVLFLLACLVPYLNPKNWWFISFLGMGFPIILLGVLAHTVLWVIAGKFKIALLSVLPMLIGWQSINVLFAASLNGSYEEVKPQEQIRVLSWNVAQFRELKVNNNKGSQTRKKMLEQIKNQHADIVCLQEFFTSSEKEFYDNISPIQEMGFPYYHYVRNPAIGNTSVIFSKFPIVDADVIGYPRPTYPERLVYADIKRGSDTIRVFSTHLESIGFKKEDYERVEKIKEGSDGLLENTKSVFSKWRSAAIHRGMQVELIKKMMDITPHPKIFTGDVNDIPNSYAYFTVRGNMQDAFLKKGFGFGRTFSAISPTLRIDYIFADKKFIVKQFKRTVNNYSDHYMIVADLELPGKR